MVEARDYVGLSQQRRNFLAVLRIRILQLWIRFPSLRKKGITILKKIKYFYIKIPFYSLFSAK